MQINLPKQNSFLEVLNKYLVDHEIIKIRPDSPEKIYADRKKMMLHSEKSRQEDIKILNRPAVNIPLMNRKGLYLAWWAYNKSTECLLRAYLVYRKCR